MRAPSPSLLGQLSSSLEPVYGFKSLHQFKTKFNPRYEPIYLLYRDEGDLSRIAAGLTRAFLPDATLRQFAPPGSTCCAAADRRRIGARESRPCPGRRIVRTGGCAAAS